MAEKLKVIDKRGRVIEISSDSDSDSDFYNKGNEVLGDEKMTDE